MKKVLITVLSMTFVLAASGKLVNFLTFNDPENLLRAAVGEEPSVVNYSKSNGISFPGGLGSCANLADATICAGLANGAGAISIPKGQALRLPHGIPTDSPHEWCLSIRFYLPDDKFGYHSLFTTSQDATVDAAMFVKYTNSKYYIGIMNDTANYFGYTVDIAPNAWHVATFSIKEGQQRMYIDGVLRKSRTAPLSSFHYGRCNLTGKPYLFISGDEDGEDNLMHFDWVKIWDEAEPEDMLVSAAPVGLWEFPADAPARATIGEDLEPIVVKSGEPEMLEQVEGLVPGDGAVRLGHFTGYKVKHNLPPKSPYTVVIDAKMPSGVDYPSNFHALWHPTGANMDGSIFLRSNDSQSPKRIRFWGKSGQSDLVSINGRSCYQDEWVRYVITWDGANRTFYADGAKVFSSTRDSAFSSSFYAILHGDSDGQGEDSPLDFTTMALYEGAMDDAQVANLGSPVATLPKGNHFDTAPAGEWVMREAADGQVPSRIGDDLAVTANGYAWSWATPSASAQRANLSYIIDFTVSETFGGGTLLETASGATVGFGYDGRLGSLEAGWSLTVPDLEVGNHRLAVINTAADSTAYYLDGVKVVWAERHKLDDAPASLEACQTVRFTAPDGATITYAAVYADPITPAGGAFAVPDAYEPAVTDGNAQPAIATIALPAGSHINTPTEVSVACSDAERDWFAIEVDFGDGSRVSSGVLRYALEAYTDAAPISHTYLEAGTYPIRVRSYDAFHRVSEWIDAGSLTVLAETASDDVLLTWPWQQNVYTNRFTIMCEAATDLAGLQLQWGEGYTETAAMSGVKGNGGTWIYKARVTVNGRMGETIPYRLAISGMPLSGTSTEGTVTLWKDDPDETFTCSVWGDNQDGANAGDWDADKFLHVQRLFEHMVQRGVDFGITTGDMASNGKYAEEIQPLILKRTDDLFARTRPYYVAWGNHDTSNPQTKPYFETAAIDEPGYLSSETGNSHLYRGNVLFIFIDHQLQDASATVTWLRNLLATPRAQAAKFRILAHHYPIYGETWGSLSQTLLETVRSGGVDIVLSGHMHGYERIEKDGFVQLTNGGAGYLDHIEYVVNNYGEATKLGGHNSVPYLWARQKSYSEPGILGAAEPVRMGCITSYGEIKVEGNTLTYTAHGFNADGSYIGVFDAFTLVSKTAPAPAPSTPAPPAPCANPASFAAFTSRPVTNAKWKEYADAAGIAFTYPEGEDDKPVVSVSKQAITQFLAWLNGTTGNYRLPTAAELTAALGSDLSGEVSEWSATLDPATGWCRIVGGNARAVPGTWCRAADRPAIATDGCFADYLGFRLATGPAPSEPTDRLAAALAAVAQIPNPGTAYLYEDGMLSDISALWWNPTADLTYNGVVILTRSGDLIQSTSRNVTLNGGLAVPNATSFTKSGSGKLTIAGPVKGGPVTSEAGWIISSGSGPLALHAVTYTGAGIQFRSGDGNLLLAGENDFFSAAVTLNATSVTNFIAETASATAFRARSMRDYNNLRVLIGEGVSVTLSEDYKFIDSILRINGVMDINGINETENLDPWILGSGTLRTTYLGSFMNSYTRLGISNIVFTSGRPWRINRTKSQDRFHIVGGSVRIASLYDWTMPVLDEMGQPYYLYGQTTYTETPRLILDTLDPDDGVTEHTFTLHPTYTDTILAIDKVNPGTEILESNLNSVKTGTVQGGTLKLAAGLSIANMALDVGTRGTLELSPADGTTTHLGSVVFDGGTFRLPDGSACFGEVIGPMVIDPPEGGTVSISTATAISGAVSFADGTDLFRIRVLFNGADPEGSFPVLDASRLTLDQVAITTDIDTSVYTVKTQANEIGDISIVISDGSSPTAVWTGEGDRTNPLDPANWIVTRADGTLAPGAIPDDRTKVFVSGTTTLNVPPGTGFTYAKLLISGLLRLGDNCDWRGLGAIVLRDDTTIDLLGHTLALTEVDGVSTNLAAITDSTTDRDRPGELHLDVPEGTTFANHKIAFTGNLKLVKDGLGVYEGWIRDQSYSGGTFVAEGTYKCGQSLDSQTGGAFGSTIEVADGAVYDLWGRTGMYHYQLILHGGTLANTHCANVKDLNGKLGNITLTDNSTLLFDDTTMENNWDIEAGAVWDLGGNTLTVHFAGRDPDMYTASSPGRLILKNGTIKTTGEGWFHDRGIDGLEGGNLDISTILRLHGDSFLNNLTIRSTSSSVISDAGKTASVYGTFTPLSPYCFNVTLMDGSAIDLRERTDAWPIRFENGITAAFEDNATITLTLAGRRFRGMEKVVSWTTPPSNLNTLTFVLDPYAEGFYTLKRFEDGLYVCAKGSVVLIR